MQTSGDWEVRESIANGEEEMMETIKMMAFALAELMGADYISFDDKGLHIGFLETGQPLPVQLRSEKKE